MPMLEIVTPERGLEDGRQVVCPGSEGELGILPHHAPLLSTLGFGELRIRKGGAEEYFAIAGGFLQVRPDKVVVMAETADLASEIDLETAQAARREAERAARGGLRRAGRPGPRPGRMQRALLRIRVAERHAPRGSAARGIDPMADARPFHWEYQEPPVQRRGVPGHGRPAAARSRPDQRQQERGAQAAGRGDADRRALPLHQRARRSRTCA